MIIRPEKEQDRKAVFDVNAAAFETPAEARLVEVLREQTEPIVSLVAESDGEIIGHILFTPVSVDGHPGLCIMGLAPVAVKPFHQGKGIGAALIRAGLEECRRIGAGAVVVLGHAGYYPRFGFMPSFRFGLASEYPVPKEYFMAAELKHGYLHDVSGTIKYHSAFSGL